MPGSKASAASERLRSEWENTTPKHGEGSPCSSVKGLPRVPETLGLIHTAVEMQDKQRLSQGQRMEPVASAGQSRQEALASAERWKQVG